MSSYIVNLDEGVPLHIYAVLLTGFGCETSSSSCQPCLHIAVLQGCVTCSRSQNLSLSLSADHTAELQVVYDL